MNPTLFDLTGPLPSGTTVLEASAGTGKTFAIAALAARYLAEGAAEVDDLLLITFSRAATAELRSRVRERIRDTAEALRAAAGGVRPLEAVAAHLADAPADEVLARINPAVGTVEPRSDGRSVLVTGGDSLETVAIWISMLGLDFTVERPSELIDHLRVLRDRYAAAVAGSPESR